MTKQRVKDTVIYVLLFIVGACFGLFYMNILDLVFGWLSDSQIVRIYRTASPIILLILIVLAGFSVRKKRYMLLSFAIGLILGLAYMLILLTQLDI